MPRKIRFHPVMGWLGYHSFPPWCFSWTQMIKSPENGWTQQKHVESTKRWISPEKNAGRFHEKRGKRVQHPNMLHAKKMLCFYSFLWLQHSIFMHFHNINWLKVVPCDGKLLLRIHLWLVLRQGNSLWRSHDPQGGDHTPYKSKKLDGGMVGQQKSTLISTVPKSDWNGPYTKIESKKSPEHKSEWRVC